ncbi:MAG: hypothetical protein ACI3VR_03320 [Intestinibacter sp.]|uniref:hypothetical protein n=1 Tax=Intestinibacter sp. TaxID=1965304 RepID=UPI003F159B7B
MNVINFKSKIIKEKDYKTVDIQQFVVPITVNKEALDYSLLKFRTKYSESILAETIEERDLVTLTCKSKNLRFSKSHIGVRVGLGLMTKEFESQLIGLMKGETKKLTVGQDSVDVTVEEIKREILPELDEKLVERCDIPGINSVDDVVDMCITEQFGEILEENVDEAFNYIGTDVINNSEFELDEEEIEVSVNYVLSIMKDMVFENEEMKKNTLSLMKESGKNMLATALVGKKYMEIQGSVLTDEDYEKYVKIRSDINNKTIEEIKSEEPKIAYAIQKYTDFYFDMLEKYVLNQLCKLGREKK